MEQFLKKAKEGQGLNKLNDMKEKAGGLDQVHSFIAENSAKVEDKVGNSSGEAMQALAANFKDAKDLD